MVASTSCGLMSSVSLPSAVAGLAAKPFDVLGFADLGAKVLSLPELDRLKNKIDGIIPPSAAGFSEIPTDLQVPDILNFGSFPVQLSPDLPLPSVVDNNFEARVADFGLAKLSLELDIQTHVSTHVIGTFGYLTSDLVVVDLGHNLITTSEEIPPIPEPEYRFLRGEILKLLHPNVVSIDQMKLGPTLNKALEVVVDHGERIMISILGLIFLKFFASILGGYRNFIENTATHIFNSHAFLKKRPRSTNQPPDPMVMESLEHRLKRGAPIIAEYLGGSVNCDAYHMTDPRSDALGVSLWRILVSMKL
ncbi:Scytalone dehydratase [Orobanche hederae]